MTIGGVFSVTLDAAAVCVVEYAQGEQCELAISGGGDAIGVAFGGDGPLTVTSECDFGDGSLDLEVSGLFSTSAIALNTCNVELTYGEPAEVVTCNCGSIGCDGDFFAASVLCENDGQTILDEDCINFTELADSFFNSDIPESSS